MNVLYLKSLIDESISQIMVCIHEGDKCLVRCFVRAKVCVNVAVIKPLGAHVIEMIRGLEFSEIGNKYRICALHNRRLEFVEGSNSLCLHAITEPCTQISFGISPGYGVRNIDNVSCRKVISSLANSHEGMLASGKPLTRQLLKECKDT